MELYIGICTVIVTFIAFIFPFYYTFKQGEREKKKNVIQFYEKYHSEEFYGKIRAPLWQIKLKWFALPDKLMREEYRNMVIKGWVRNELGDGKENIDSIIKYPNDKSQADDHLKRVIKFDGFTEHEILSIALEFWVTLNILRKENVFNNRTLKIFKNKYDYDREFILSLRSSIKEASAMTGKQKLPNWVAHTEELEAFFDAN